MVNEINIGITGASGFIGKSLTSFFKNKRINVIVIKSRLNKIEGLKNEIELLPKLDIVYHLAGSFQGEWESLYDNNFLSTKNLLSCLNPKMTKVIFTSTGSVYGNSGNFGVDESFECQPVDDYGKIKLISEKLVNDYGNYLIFRLPSVYGNGNNKGVIYHWQNSIAAGKTLKVGDNGLSYRSFLHINDLISIFYLSIKIDKPSIYNLSENKSFSMIELASIISKDKKDNIDFFKSNNLLKSMVLKNDKFCKETNFIFSNLINYLDEN
jgi:nucleoside-diphosphate-sugar epimerase